MAGTLPLAARAAGELRLPEAPHAVIVMACDRAGGGIVMRDTLQAAQFATLQLDHSLSDPAILPGAHARRLAEQLLSAADGWLRHRKELTGLPVGVFGVLAGGGAALAAAAARPDLFRALVLRDPWPHVPGAILDGVHAATLLIVGGHDDGSIARAQDTMARVQGIAELEILSGTSVTCDDPDTIVQVARLARRWFDRFLS